MLNYRNLSIRARECLAGYSVKKWILIHTAVTLGISLVLSLAHYLLSLGIGETGGLGGMGQRAMLETIQSMVQMANYMLLPFWQIGLVSLWLRVSRHQPVTGGNLLDGFRIWGPVLRSLLVKAAALFVVVYLGSQIGASLFLFTPAGQTMTELLGSATDTAKLMEDPQFQQLSLEATPWILGACLLVGLPVLYRLRLLDYVLLDNPRKGALFAMRMSIFAMRKRCLKLVKLDLGFWWFYALEVLGALVCYGDWILPLFGVKLPMNVELASFLFYLGGVAVQLGLYLWKLDEVSTAYALAYQELLPPEPEAE